MLKLAQPMWRHDELRKVLIKHSKQDSADEDNILIKKQKPIEPLSDVKFRKLNNLPENLTLNVRGKFIETKLEILNRIQGSVLADIFTGKVYSAVDDKGLPVIDSQPEPFEDMLRFLKEHRTWLPSAKKGTKIKRDLAETEIRKWRVDVGLAKPSVLMTQVARDLQKVYNTEPDFSFCDSKGAMEKWRQYGPVKLSWIA